MTVAYDHAAFVRRFPFARMLPGFTPDMGAFVQKDVLRLAPGPHGLFDVATILFHVRQNAFAKSLSKAGLDILCRVIGHVMRVAGGREVMLNAAGNPYTRMVHSPDRTDRATVTGTVPANEKGRVGLFFVVTVGGVLYLLAWSVPLRHADVYGEKLTVDIGHDEVWERLKAMGPVGLRDRGLPLVPLTAEYDLHPRGRVVYDPMGESFSLGERVRENGRYNLMLDHRRHQPAVVQAIRDAFSLGDSSFDLSGDPHYRTEIPLEDFRVVEIHQLAD